jgi:ribA/ribD-fused uncharacterized protein
MNEIPDESLLAGVSRLLMNSKLQNRTKCNLAVNPELTSTRTQSVQDKTKEKRKRLHTKSKNGVTLFYGKDSIFSNLHTETPIFIDGRNFYYNEQYYTYCKARFFHDNDAAQKALQIQDPYELVKLQKKIQNVDRVEWLPEAEQTLYLANMAKYSQNTKAREALLQTRNDIIGEASFSRTWGIGSSLYDPESLNLNWSGRNIMGNILMQIRDSLCNKHNEKQTMSSPMKQRSSQASQHNRSCWFCGETNHVSKNCRHGQKIQCNSCYSLGHKAKFCLYG